MHPTARPNVKIAIIKQRHIQIPQNQVPRTEINKCLLIYAYDMTSLPSVINYIYIELVY